MKGDEPMPFQAIAHKLRTAIAAHRVLATRRQALDQIARHPEHLARDVDLPVAKARAGLTVIVVSAIGCPVRQLRQSFNEIDDCHKLYSFD
jgi:hypothetical protein